MTLDEAIKHCIDKAKDPEVCTDCRNDHLQLSMWLTELQTRRKMWEDLMRLFDSAP